MAFRRAPGGRLSANRFAAEAPRRRGVFAAFGLGAAIAAAGLAADGAAARGLLTGAYGGYAPRRASLTLLPLDPNAGKPRHKPRRDRIVWAKPDDRIAWVKPHEEIATPAQGDAVCVRLCDGYFFPLPAAADDAASQTASCDSQCPDAPTQVYFRPASARIEESVSAAGQPYTALPTALRYRSTADSACSCHRDAVAYAPLADATLQPGDLIMTPAGFVMFRGSTGPERDANDFVTLAQARLPSALRGNLQAMEQVSLAADHPTLQQWLASRTSPALAERGIERVVAGAASGDDKIHLLVWRGGDQD